MTAAPAPADTRDPAAGPRAAAVVLLPGPQRGGQPRGAGRSRRSRPCRRSPDSSRSSPSTTARRTGRSRSPSASPPSTRTSCGSSTTRSTAATAAPSGRASRRPATSSSRFTDGDRQFRVADLGRLTARLGRGRPARTSSSATGSSAPTRSIRVVYARTYKLANRIFFGLKVRDVDCACKLFRREALEGVRVESGGAFFSAELLIKIQAAGRSVAQVGIPHYPRTAGSPTGAKPSVIWRAVKDFWGLRLRMWANRERAGRRGRPILGVATGHGGRPLARRRAARAGRPRGPAS